MLFFKKKEKRAEGEVQFGDNLLTALIGGGSAASRKSALEIPAVQSCVELLAGIVSSLPVKLYEETDGKVTEVKDDIRTRLLNGDTGDVINGTELRKQWVRDYFLGKGAYTYIDRDIYGKPRGLYYVSENRVSVTPNSEPIFKDYTVLVEGKAYPKSDFLKIFRNSRGNGRGVSIIEESPIILLTAYNTMRFENSVVKKGGNKRGFLTSQKQLTKAVMESIKEAWGKMFSNSIDAEDNICVLNEGMDFKESSATALEMQLNENKNTNSAEICKLFCVPPEILSGNASQEVRENFVSNSVAPLLNVFEAAMDSDLLLENEKGRRYFAFDTRELTRGNIQQRYNAYSVGLKSGFLQFDDVRNLEDLEPLDFPYIKLGLNDVLYNPATKEVYTPNTNAFVDLGKAGVGLEKDVHVDGDTADSRAEELRFNPYHDPETGRFSNGNFGSSAKVFSDKKVFSNSGAKSIDKSEKSGIIKSSDDGSYISATGPNEFKKGFDAYNLADHWYGGGKAHSHKDEYPSMTMEQYAERALTLVQMPTSKTVLGYKTRDGCVVRYDSVNNDFVKGKPSDGIITMFKPKNGTNYYYDKEKNNSKED